MSAITARTNRLPIAATPVPTMPTTARSAMPTVEPTTPVIEPPFRPQYSPVNPAAIEWAVVASMLRADRGGIAGMPHSPGDRSMTSPGLVLRSYMAGREPVAAR